MRVGYALAILCGIPLVTLLSAAFGAVSGAVLGLAVFLTGAGIAALSMHRSYPHHELGLCNAITIGRLALTASLVAILVAPVPLTASDMWLAFAVAVLALALDGVDGWAARRAGLASRFGARFDMEVDSFFALVLSAIAFQTGQAGLWILALGLPRYMFVGAGAIWPWLTRPVPDSLSRKAVCVLQIGTLVAFLIPVLPASLLTLAAAVAAVALVWSFLRDIRTLIALRQ
ncbi:MAG: CDP-alcohol phosphatidyltransferase family protein [Pseudomonadota bacterium]